MSVHPIELLAPAGTLQNGIAAINHGADAVYAAGPKFGARAAAGCSLRELEQLVKHAHLFRAKVYIALNTILTDQELPEAVRLTRKLYDLGADGLIIQDFGLLEADLPPIPLHSSTQMNNQDVEKVKFLEDVGFSQVVLARELSLEKIKNISSATNVTLEFFVHGALCVAYSGQCYMSEVVAGRSANRGECAQFCRHKYTLQDQQGKLLEKNKYLLSLKDLDLSAHLSRLLDAGVRSFKIEGRLKDETYVKNTTAYYRQAIDTLIAASNGNLCRSSSGSTQFLFTPDPERSFHRGQTDYYLNSSRNDSAEIRSSKSTGKRLGVITRSEEKWFSLATDEIIANGDGLCFFDQNDQLVGLRVNRVDGERIYPRDSVSLEKGQILFRNSDQSFIHQVGQSQLCRTLALEMSLREVAGGLLLQIQDEDKIESATFLGVEKQRAKNPGASSALAEKQLCKSGGTFFKVQYISIELEEDSYYAAAVFNALRRDGIVNHSEQRLSQYRSERIDRCLNNVPWPAASISYLDNIANKAAENFFRRHGVQIADRTKLRAIDNIDCALMTTKYCIRFQLGKCPKQSGSKEKTASPLILTDNTGSYSVHFNCAECEMVIRKGRQVSGS